MLTMMTMLEIVDNAREPQTMNCNFAQNGNPIENQTLEIVQKTKTWKSYRKAKLEKGKLARAGAAN